MKRLLTLLIILLPVFAFAQFGVGDAVITSYESTINNDTDLDDGYCITLLKGANLGDTLSITDKGYSDLTGFASNEGHVKIIFNGFVPCGTTICLQRIDTSNSHLLTIFPTMPDSLLHVVGSPLRLSTQGDGIYLTYGQYLPTPQQQGKFITAVNFNRSQGSSATNWDGDNDTPQKTALADALTDGVNAFRIPSPERNNGQYDYTNLIITSSSDMYNDPAKWRFSDTAGGFMFPVPLVFECDIATTIHNVNQSQNELIAYPNPAHSTITVRGNLSDGLRIYSLTGALVQCVPKQSGTHAIVNISALSSGVYYVVSYGGVQARIIVLR